MEEYVEQNAKAWDHLVEKGNIWTDGVTDKQIEAARSGELDMVLSPFKRVKAEWVGDVRGKKVLALACGGGQQGPLLALAGAEVTVFDASEKQLAQDRRYAEKLNLDMKLIRGDMRDLSMFDDESFDLVYNPTSTCYIDEVRGMYQHVHRILKAGSYFLTSITNPVLYLFDEQKALKNKLKIKYTIPFSTLKSPKRSEVERIMKGNDTIEFSHTLDDLLGGITDSGFFIQDIYSDGSGFYMMDSFIHDCHLAVRAYKAKGSL
ncbi:MAG TPA: class I SAM-dependent methyltransferase [Sphaerochaeta sp.]|jgi:ubiquinone/menaquinone biosynthesis C-methylase UbiE|nr:class I SAM-dependent methyltransferase [Spirochaetota bacterium]NLV61259.1 methyltransferase domain-containing protein [Spirochaetales bacterium]HOE83788.1 class I SAM-dependent methyltransferase [Sphaerochaeta sp.]HOQ94885.1 class I SAM-dependent methyltransferase [Sphaerochaeta sp.]HPK46691.1 class I SAM-dependent methyltransferase [Sphaerochaeta sp.]